MNNQPPCDFCGMITVLQDSHIYTYMHAHTHTHTSHQSFEFLQAVFQPSFYIFPIYLQEPRKKGHLGVMFNP